MQASSNAGKTAPAAGDTNVTFYEWDNRDRLTEARSYAGTFVSSTATPSQVIVYMYDAENRWVGKDVYTNVDPDQDPSASPTSQTRYMYDGNEIVLQFDASGSGTVTEADLSHRYLWAPAIDQLLADEQVTSPGQAGTINWALTDQLNSVRDLVNNSGQTTSHAAYNSFGQLAPGDVDACLIGYTGRPFDGGATGTGLQNNLNRWYNPAVGRWMSQDPSGFEAGDSNLYRYVGNWAVRGSDPSGLATLDFEPAPENAPWKNEQISDRYTYAGTISVEQKLTIHVTGQGCAFGIKAHIVAKFRIILDIDKIEDHNRNIWHVGVLRWTFGWVPTYRTAYGHEQRHLVADQKFYENLATHLRRRSRAFTLTHARRRSEKRPDLGKSTAKLSTIGRN